MFRKDRERKGYDVLGFNREEGYLTILEFSERAQKKKPSDKKRKIDKAL